jgi:hypothetical protein
MASRSRRGRRVMEREREREEKEEKERWRRWRGRRGERNVGKEREREREEGEVANKSGMDRRRELYIDIRNGNTKLKILIWNKIWETSGRMQGDHKN